MSRGFRALLLGIAGWPLLSLPLVGQETLPKNKYGPSAVRLFESREHIRESAAPDYWALMPYYRAQPGDSACSVAAVTMLLNGLRVHQKLAASEPLITPENLLEKLGDRGWSQAVGAGGEGVSLEGLGTIVRSSLKAYSLHDYRVEVVHIKEASPAELARLKNRLAQNEESDRNFLIANFLQSTFTGDPEGRIGHFAPIAAYDAKRGRVLIFDPDRNWYEPYWVSDQTLLEGLATQDPDAKRSRGYLWISRPENPMTDGVGRP